MKNENYILREFDEAAHKIVNEGFDIEDDRTGIGTRCLFGISTKYDISKRVPIPTKRKVNKTEEPTREMGKKRNVSTEQK